ncbi:MAG: DNA repair protein RecN [Lactobacillus sp.]|jgi:DNA repair protein RecN (Recombination protein N)|nr:DNA repair protein RecN [Lactobacillus sp.]
MLTRLEIKNVVLIDRLDLDFSRGLSVLTGETGAGKSILLDSLGLVLGNRAETSLIRHGEDKLNVTACFKLDNKNHPLYDLLKEYELEADDEIIIKRSLDSNGKGKIFINDQSITAKLLKEIGKTLVEIHGQFDNQGLLNPANHLDVLDSFGGYNSFVLDVKEKYQSFKSARKARAEAEDNLSNAKTEEENLRYYIDELKKIKTHKGEEEELSQRRLELMNSEKLLESLNFAFASLNHNEMRQAELAISKANDLVNGKYDDIVNLIDQASINLNEAINSIEDASNNISHNQNELENIEGRLFALKGLARKHQTQVDELADLLDNFEKQLSTIELGEEGLNELRRKEEETKLAYIKSANKLSEKRAEAAKDLDKKVMAELPPLKMDKAKFVTMIGHKDEPDWTSKGFDDVYFTVSTNPNSPQGAINKIASGGELARFMLALKVNLAGCSNVATMIFDEVDSGIGGATAQAVGDRLSKLASQVQVLVVTHSPQVASNGNNHFKVEKSTKNNITTTKVEKLNKEQKQEEIARMLAGDVITDEARAAAKALIG